MKRLTLVTLLLSLATACAAEDPESVGSSPGDNADNRSEFTPEFCGVNVLKSGQVFVGEVCTGVAAQGWPAVRVTYSDKQVEIYEIDSSTFVDDQTQGLFVFRHRDDLEVVLRDLLLGHQRGELSVHTAISGIVDRGLPFEVALTRR